MPKKKRPIPKKLPAKLQAIRRRAGLKQYEMRRLICPASEAIYEYSNSPISEYEAGRRAPSLKELLSYAKLGQVTAEFLIDDEVEIYEYQNSQAANKPPSVIERSSEIFADEVVPTIFESNSVGNAVSGFETSQKFKFSKTAETDVRLKGRAFALIGQAYADIADAALSPEHQRQQGAHSEFDRQRYFEITVGAALELFFEERNERFAAMWQQVWQKIIEASEFLAKEKD